MRTSSPEPASTSTLLSSKPSRVAERMTVPGSSPPRRKVPSGRVTVERRVPSAAVTVTEAPATPDPFPSRTDPRTETLFSASAWRRIPVEPATNFSFRWTRTTPPSDPG